MNETVRRYYDEEERGDGEPERGPPRKARFCGEEGIVEEEKCDYDEDDGGDFSEEN